MEMEAEVSLKIVRNRMNNFYSILTSLVFLKLKGCEIWSLKSRSKFKGAAFLDVRLLKPVSFLLAL